MDACAVNTTCPYCGVGCGIAAKPLGDGGASIAGEPDHPANFGLLCSKGTALGETLSLEGRLLHPIVDGRRASWDEALDRVAEAFCDAIGRHGPDSVALYVSGQILTEDYYVANKLMKGFVGTSNIDTNSRLCMASSVAGHKRAFGSDTVPGSYEDIDQADLVVLVGSNLAWCHPVLFQRLAAARERRGTKIVVIDPRRTATCEIADMHLALAPGSDVAIFNGLLNAIAGSPQFDRRFVGAHTTGFDAALACAKIASLAEIALCCGLARESLEAFYDLFLAHEKTVTIYSQGVNQSTSGVDKVNAIINCHLASGRIGRPGMGPFSVTGQPNAMGGREAGGLANMLACHMELANEEHRDIVRSFWRSPVLAQEPGLKAVDLFRAVGAGKIKALWIMGTNPAVSLPEADDVRAALRGCDFVCVSDVVQETDSAACAHVLLPSLAWGEKSGTVTNSERRISRQRAFLPPPGQARADWRQICDVAARLGFGAAFAYSDVSEIFGEYAALSGYRNDGVRDFDISAYAGISSQDYEALAPFQWPQRAGQARGQARFFADGDFFTPDRKGRFVAVEHAPPASAPDAAYPFALNTGRIRDQWHTMTRTAKTPRLMAHTGEPFVEMHPDDARACGVRDAELARVASARGGAILRVLVSDRQRRGSVFAPMHWTSEHANAARINTLIAGHMDKLSGQPELKFTPVAVAPLEAGYYGFAVSVAPPYCDELLYWARARARAGWRLEFALAHAPDDWAAFAARMLQAGAASEVLRYDDAATRQHRFAVVEDGRLAGLLFVSGAPVAASRAWAAQQIGAGFETNDERMRILSGRAAENAGHGGAIVCACFDVGANDIARAVREDGCSSVAAVGAHLQAGTNCGSCRAEIARIVAANPVLETV